MYILFGFFFFCLSVIFFFLVVVRRLLLQDVAWELLLLGLGLVFSEWCVGVLSDIAVSAGAGLEGVDAVSMPLSLLSVIKNMY